MPFTRQDKKNALEHVLTALDHHDDKLTAALKYEGVVYIDDLLSLDAKDIDTLKFPHKDGKSGITTMTDVPKVHKNHIKIIKAYHRY